MRKDAKEGEDDDEEGSLKDFICDEDEDSDTVSAASNRVNDTTLF